VTVRDLSVALCAREAVRYSCISTQRQLGSARPPQRAAADGAGLRTRVGRRERCSASPGCDRVVVIPTGGPVRHGSSLQPPARDDAGSARGSGVRFPRRPLQGQTDRAAERRSCRREPAAPTGARAPDLGATCSAREVPPGPGTPRPGRCSGTSVTSTKALTRTRRRRSTARTTPPRLDARVRRTHG
jgi:hypothetical protein